MNIKVPQNIIVLARTLKSYGEIFIVGGYVRNAILGIGNIDIDLASKIRPEVIKEALKNTSFKVKDKSKKLGTLVISCDGEEYEYSTFRKEVYSEGGEHSPKEIEFIEDINEDAKRRDFTINAIYYNVLKEEIVDMYSGQYDLFKKQIRAIETPEYVFENDGLRILRMIRFACQLNFTIDKATLSVAEKMVYRLKDITGTRKLQELELILHSNKYLISKKNSYLRGLEMFNKLKIWHQLYVPISKITLKMVRKVKQEDIFYGLLIDIIDSLHPDCIGYYLRYLLGSEGLNMPTKKSEAIISVINGYYDALNKMQNKDYFFRYFSSFEKISDILPLKARFTFSKYQFFYKYIINHELPIQIKDLKIDGDDLKKSFPKLQDKKYGIILKDLLNKVFEGEIANEKEVLLEEVKKNVRYY